MAPGRWRQSAGLCESAPELQVPNRCGLAPGRWRRGAGTEAQVPARWPSQAVRRSASAGDWRPH
eukprot:6021054-Lingulodinium_polyedra.AAC.1